MIRISSSLLQKQIVYLVFLILFFYTYKPTIVFKPNGKLREYGVGNDSEGYKKTFYTFQFLIILCVVGVIYLVK